MDNKILNSVCRPNSKEDITINFRDRIKVVIGNGPFRVKTSEQMDSLLVEENIGNVYEYVGTTNEKYVNGAFYIVEEGE